MSDLLTPASTLAVPMLGQPYSQTERQVGAYCVKHQPPSQARARRLALSHERWPRNRV